MADQPDNPMRVYLRRIDGKVDRPVADMHDVEARLAGVEENLAGVIAGSTISNFVSSGSSAGSISPTRRTENSA